MSAQLGLVCECVQGTPLFCMYSKGDTTTTTKKKEGEKRHTKNKRERERERDDFLVLFCDHEDGDGWDDREE